MRIEELQISEQETVLGALRQLDATGRKTLFVINESGVLLAVVTDGDVRRHLLAGGGLNDPVQCMANYTPIALSYSRIHCARSVIREHGVYALPVVDAQGRLVDVKFASGRDLASEQVLLPVVMMAGGLGTRLYPYTKILPKPLIPIGELPIAEHIVNRFYKAGCRDFIFVLNYKKSMIKSYFNELEKDYHIEYADEDEPLGTGGGLYLLADRLQQTFFLTNCDILVDVDFAGLYRFHCEQGNQVTMVCALKDYTIPYGVIEQENGELMEMKEKPQLSFYINTGLYVVEPSVLGYIQPGVPTPFTDLIEAAKQDGGRIGVYPVSEQSWMDMGQLEELEHMRRRLEEQG